MPVIGRRDITIKRDDVADWLANRGSKSPEEIVREKIQELELNDTSVDMGDVLGIVPLADVIMMEIDSYG